MVACQPRMLELQVEFGELRAQQGGQVGAALEPASRLEEGPALIVRHVLLREGGESDQNCPADCISMTDACKDECFDYDFFECFYPGDFTFV